MTTDEVSVILLTLAIVFIIIIALHITLGGDDE